MPSTQSQNDMIVFIKRKYFVAFPSISMACQGLNSRSEFWTLSGKSRVSEGKSQRLGFLLMIVVGEGDGRGLHLLGWA